MVAPERSAFGFDLDRAVFGDAPLVDLVFVSFSFVIEFSPQNLSHSRAAVLMLNSYDKPL